MESSSPDKLESGRSGYPFDRAAIAAIAFLSLCLSGLTLAGTYWTPRVSEFSWNNKRISARDRTWTLAFAQPMAHQSVEENLRITPELPGRIYWRGNQMYYVANQPPQYGQTYTLQLSNAQAEYGEFGQVGRTLRPFQAQFTTRDRVFAYLGTFGEERDRLILYNLTREQKTILTPADLLVVDFQPYPDGDRILFSAVARDTVERDPTAVSLFTVTTGIPNLGRGQLPGRVQSILDSNDYQNLQFDLSADGQIILVERLNRQNARDRSLWIIEDGQKARSLGIPGEIFAISPDSQSVAVVQEGGISMIPLTPRAKPLEFLAGYDSIVAFSRDTFANVLLEPNAEGTRSLVLLSRNGVKQEIMRTRALIPSCQFSPQQANILYCLKLDSEQQPSEPILSIVDLEQRTETPFLALVNDREVVLSMAPDGSGLLFDQAIPTTASAPGQEAFKANIWYLPLPEISGGKPKISPPKKLIPGLNPRWLP